MLNKWHIIEHTLLYIPTLLSMTMSLSSRSGVIRQGRGQQKSTQNCVWFLWQKFNQNVVWELYSIEELNFRSIYLLFDLEFEINLKIKNKFKVQTNFNRYKQFHNEYIYIFLIPISSLVDNLTYSNLIISFDNKWF